jgi:hypothetical protein
VHLLITDTRPADAVLDHAIPWTDDLDEALELRPDDGDVPESEDTLPAERSRHWYEPRLSALRRLIAEQQSWEIR